MNFFKEKGPWILFGQFLFLDFPLKVFLVGPPNHTFTYGPTLMCSSQNSNKICLKIKKCMSLQNPWAPKCKNGKKNIYYFYTIMCFFLLMLSWCEVHMMYNLTRFVHCDVILHKTMQFLCIRHEHLHMSFKKMFQLFEYFRYWMYTNIVHINHSMKVLWFLYKPMKIKFCTKFVQTYEVR
jgi:hypothetical protein